MFEGDAVAMPSAFQSIRFGMSPAELQKAAPDLITAEPTRTFSIPSIEGCSFTLHRDERERLVEIEIVISSPAPQEALTRLWGPPETDEFLVARWYNPKAGMRASMEVNPSGGPRPLRLSAFQPLLALLGPGPTMAFEAKAPLLGMTLEEVETKYPANARRINAREYAKRSRLEISDDALPPKDAPAKMLMLELPPTRWGKKVTPIFLFASDDGKIGRYSIRLETVGRESEAGAVFAHFEDKWGKGEESDSGMKYSSDPEILASKGRRGAISLVVDSGK